MDEISLDDQFSKQNKCNSGLKHLPRWPPVNIKFQDLVYTVPEKGGDKVLLKGLSGEFRSSQLTAILGPSGAGKSTLLNVLAGYRIPEVNGNIYINGRPRNMATFCRMSRYIMQQDLQQPMLTVREAMMVSADLKLGSDLNENEKNEVIDEILSLLRLTNAADTMGHNLSGGERKRLSIALELVNNPPIVFLDEPTTGLDDISCSQCVSLLRRIAHGGRTIVCSVHTPTAKIFEMFDHVYVVANGQCAYQGRGYNIVDYMLSIGLNCPVTYNPADFAIEVSCGEYGEQFIDSMIMAIENGKCRNWMPPSKPMNSNSIDRRRNYDENENNCTDQFEIQIDPRQLKPSCTNWEQFKILTSRRTKQMWRDSSYMKLKIYMTFFQALVIAGLYQGIGNDATKALFNFGFCFTVLIAFMYNPLMPVLLQFPSEINLLKREHFNQWYKIGPYYAALVIAKLPVQLVLTIIYLTIIYLASEQSLELKRVLMFYSIAIILALTSESLGLLIASRLSLINGMFVGPVFTVPMMLLAVYGIGFGKDVEIPTYMRIIMSFDYLRYGLEGFMDAMYGYDRRDFICPPGEQFCLFQKADFLKTTLGFNDANFYVSIVALLLYYILFTAGAYYMIKNRLSPNRTQYAVVQYVFNFAKTYLNFAPYKY